jgi:tetratricopeptide (TPR) repeat protein
MPVWDDFIRLVTSYGFYLNLNVLFPDQLLNAKFYFIQAKENYATIKQALKAADSQDPVTAAKNCLNVQFGLSKIKALNRRHELLFGYGNFHILLLLGELYHRTNLRGIEIDTRYWTAKGYYEKALELAETNKDIYLESKYNLLITHEIDAKQIRSNFIKRLSNNMIDCYLYLHSTVEADYLIERSYTIAESNAVFRDKPFFYLLISKILTRQKEYTKAYKACQQGLNLLKKGAAFNPEIFNSLEELEGALLANLAYALEKNWKDCGIVFPSKPLSSIPGIYRRALKLYPLNWISKKVTSTSEPGYWHREKES